MCLRRAAQSINAELPSGKAPTTRDQWGDKYPKVIQSWCSKWPKLSAYFKYPEYVRTTIYTTNAVEAVHRQFRKLTKTKGGFANENCLLKLLYAGILKALRALDASHTELEPDAIAADDSLPRKTGCSYQPMMMTQLTQSFEHPLLLIP